MKNQKYSFRLMGSEGKEKNSDGLEEKRYINENYIEKTIKMREFYSPQRVCCQLILPFSKFSHLISAF